MMEFPNSVHTPTTYEEIRGMVAGFAFANGMRISKTSDRYANAVIDNLLTESKQVDGCKLLEVIEAVDGMEQKCTTT